MMSRKFFALALVLLPVCSLARTESFLQKILRITGISATPSQQKAPGEEEFLRDDIWVVDVKTGSAKKFENTTDFHSPIFGAGDHVLFAFYDSTLCRVSGVQVENLHRVPGLVKLVGIDRDDPDKILVLIQTDRVTRVALLSIATGKVTEVPYDSNSPEDRKLLQHLKDWERVYGETKVYSQTQTREGPVGPVQWTDVFLKKGNAAPINVSHCDGDNCGQPSLSHDGTKVVFVRQKQ